MVVVVGCTSADVQGSRNILMHATLSTNYTGATSHMVHKVARLFVEDSRVTGKVIKV